METKEKRLVLEETSYLFIINIVFVAREKVAIFLDYSTTFNLMSPQDHVYTNILKYNFSFNLPKKNETLFVEFMLDDTI
jgi:hypothetical protein